LLARPGTHSRCERAIAMQLVARLARVRVGCDRIERNTERLPCCTPTTVPPVTSTGDVRARSAAMTDEQDSTRPTSAAGKPIRPVALSPSNSS
jgi:hypothetical protein